MRSEELPIDCCIQDIKGLWQHIRTTFNVSGPLKASNITLNVFVLSFMKTDLKQSKLKCVLKLNTLEE